MGGYICRMRFSVLSSSSGRGGLFLGVAFIGDALLLLFIGDALLLRVFIGDAFIGDAFIGDALLLRDCIEPLDGRPSRPIAVSRRTT